MQKFRLCMFFLFLFAFFPQMNLNNAYGQQLNLTEVNANGFPRVEVGVSVLNRFGDTEKDLLKSDFRVVENGIDVTSTLDMECFGGDEPQELNVILVIDKSGSMDKDPYDPAYPNNLRRFDWVEKAVKIFLNEFTFYKRSQVSIIAFGGKAEVRCPFTQDTTRLLDSLKKTLLAGATNYNDPLIGEYNSVIKLYKDLPADYQTGMKTVVIFLTDGQPSSNTPTKTFDIVEGLKQYNIQMYSITLLTEMNKDLEYISQLTGGRATRVDAEQDLINIYKIIASEIQNKVFCVLKWLSPYGCDPNNLEREVKVTYKKNNLTTTKRYFAPPTSIAETYFSDDVVPFGNPAVDDFSIRNFYIVAQHGDMNVSNIVFSPAGPYFELVSVKVKNVDVGTKFTLKEGDTAYFEVKFTQKDKIEYRPANLVIQGTPCERVIPIYGGVSDVVLLNPHSGYFKNCEDIQIRWAGVDPSTPVNIYYSIDGGKTWALLEKDAKGLSYTWLKSKFPAVGDKYKIKLEVLPISFYQFANSYGNPQENYARTIALSNDSLSLYFTGYFTGTLKLGNYQISSKGDFDIFLAKADNIGNILWAKSAGGSLKDTAYAVAVDDEGNAYITGTIKGKDVVFGGTGAAVDYDDVDVFFVAKYPSDGKNAPLVYTLSKNGTMFSGFQARGVNIRVTGSGANTRIRAVGQFNGTAISFTENGSPYSLKNKDSQFEAIFDKNMKLTGLISGPVSMANPNPNPEIKFAKDVAYDYKNDLRYNIGSYTGTKNFAPYTLTSAGANDIYFTKYGKNKASLDSSKKVFSIEKPTLKFLVPNYTFSAQKFGEGASRVFTASLTNLGDLPIEILDKYIQTANATDFSITNLPSRIEPKETVSVEIEFRPTGVGNRTSKLFVLGECADLIEIPLIGVGTCGTAGLLDVNVGSTNINSPKITTVNAVFENPNYGTIKITPTIINDALAEFKILKVNGADYSGAAIDVSGLSKVDLEIEFTPKQAGTRTAQIDFKVSDKCDDFVTNLSGKGVANAVFAETLNFSKKRIKTVNKENLVFKNTSSLSNKIISLSLEDNTYFELSNVNLPLTVNANDSVIVTVIFKPTTETNYSTKVIFKLENSDEVVDGDITGVGINPQIKAALICPAVTVKEGETGAAYLRLYNNSTLENTNLDTLTISANSPYTFIGNSQKTIAGLGPIPFADSIDIPVLFAPKVAGPAFITVDIQADTAVGNGIDEKYPNFVTYVFKEGACSARSLGGDIPLDFGKVLYCDTKEIDVELPINENVEDLVIDFSKPIIFSGADGKYFTHNLTSAINPIKFLEAAKVFKITFKPDANRAYTTDLKLVNNLGQNITYKISAEGVIPTLFSSEDKNVTFAPGGEGVKLHYSVNIPKLDNGPITSLTTLVYFNSKMVYFMKDKLTGKIKDVISTLPNWTWETPTLIQDGVLQVKGTGALVTPISGDLFTLEYKIYLGDLATSNIEFATQINECTQDRQLGTIVNLGNMCFVEGRLVDLSSVEFGTTIAPNPVTSELKATIGIGFDVPVKIELVNSIGEIVATPVDNEMKQGVYDITMPVDNLSNGLYFLRVITGPYVETRSVIIQK